MSDEKKSEMDNESGNMMRARPPVGTYNSFENELLTVLHLLKYNLHLNAKAQVSASLVCNKAKTTEEAVALTEEVIYSFRKNDGVVPESEK